MKQIGKKTGLLKIVEVIAAVLISLMPVLSVAALPNLNCNDLNGVSCQSTTATGLIKTVINWLLALAGLIAILFLIIGGFWYITSAGNEETAEKGKNTVINALIGIVVIILSYVIINVVSNLVSNPNSTTAP